MLKIISVYSISKWPTRWVNRVQCHHRLRWKFILGKENRYHRRFPLFCAAVTINSGITIRAVHAEYGVCRVEERRKSFFTSALFLPSSFPPLLATPAPSHRWRLSRIAVSMRMNLDVVKLNHGQSGSRAYRLNLTRIPSSYPRGCCAFLQSCSNRGQTDSQTVCRVGNSCPRDNWMIRQMIWQFDFFNRSSTPHRFPSFNVCESALYCKFECLEYERYTIFFVEEN